MSLYLLNTLSTCNLRTLNTRSRIACIVKIWINFYVYLSCRLWLSQIFPHKCLFDSILISDFNSYSYICMNILTII